MLKHTASLLSIGSGILVIFFSILLLIPEKKNQKYPLAKLNTVQKVTKPKELHLKLNLLLYLQLKARNFCTGLVYTKPSGKGTLEQESLPYLA